MHEEEQVHADEVVQDISEGEDYDVEDQQDIQNDRIQDLVGQPNLEAENLLIAHGLKEMDTSGVHFNG